MTRQNFRLAKHAHTPPHHGQTGSAAGWQLYLGELGPREEVAYLGELGLGEEEGRTAVLAEVGPNLAPHLLLASPHLKLLLLQALLLLQKKKTTASTGPVVGRRHLRV